MVERSTAALASVRPDEHIGILLLDVEGFQMLNDSFGYEAGDEVLGAVAERLRAVVREGDSLARVGPDEFAVLCERVRGRDEVISMARRFTNLLRTPFSIQGQQIFLGAHVGIALSDGEIENVIDLVRNADTAMNRAKASGDRWRIYHSDMREQSRQFLAMASDLRHAITRRQLRVEYQPIVALADGKPYAFEALTRWNHPVRGSVPPDEFIPVAEKAGLISEIGEWVLHEAVAAAVRWSDLSGLDGPRVSVNVSAQQLADPDFIYTVARCGEHWQLPFDKLILEVTESGVMENLEVAVETLRVLSGLGISVALDDFGTGASSLAQLKQLRWIDILKIDKSFVDDVCADDENSAIVRTIVGLAHALDMSVVAEGVEQESQARQLASAGCAHAQGWHYGRPLRPTAADSLVVATSRAVVGS
jgi:diguanylate cyclase (GGDEF)-like protein